MQASGAIIRSTEEWDISRSCHKATFSKAGLTELRTIRAKPVRFSLKTGLRLWGIAELPFCPLAKNSSTSKTSVLWRCLISTAIFSIDEAITPSVAKNIAWRSRGITWLEVASDWRFNFLATYSCTFGEILAWVPTAPDIAQTAISFLAFFNLCKFLENSA